MRRLEIAPTAGLPPRLTDLLVWPRAGRLEAALAAMLGQPAQVECSGTACLVIALEALKQISDRRMVIIPAYTCPLVVLAIAKAGLQAIACDLAPDSFDLDAAHLDSLLSQDTLCVIATHYSGALTDVAGLRALLPPDVYIIEDAAQAFGGHQRGEWAGFVGDIGFYSFALGKGFTTYEGGALVARTPAMRERLAQAAARLRRWRPGRSLWLDINFLAFHFLYNGLGLRLIYGFSKNYWLQRGDEIRAIGDYFDDDIPIYKISAWRASVGAAALPRLKAHLAWASATHARIAAALAYLSTELCISPIVGHFNARPTGTLVFVTLPSRTACERALALLWRSPLGVSKLFAEAIGDYEYLSGKLLPSDTPNARDLAARTLTLSASPRLTDADIAEIVSRMAAAMAEF